MKRRIAAIFGLLAAVLTLTLPAHAVGREEAEEVYIASLIAMEPRRGEQAAAALAERGTETDWRETLMLAKAIYACTGNRSFSDEWRLCIGEVILNRVASPEFPDTVEAVVRGDSRYCGKVEGYLDAVRPDRAAASAALRLMEGERVMGERTVVWQDCHYYDGGVYKSLYDYRVGNIFFCLTTHPELY